MIYMLSRDLQLSAETLCDKHLNESIVDTASAVSYYLWLNHSDTVAFDAANYFNPNRKSETPTSKIPRAFYPLKGGQRDFYDWVLMHPNRYSHLLNYLRLLTDEYAFRFYKTHKVGRMIEYLPELQCGIVDSTAIRKRVEGCVDRYQSSSKLWLWTTRDAPKYVI